MTARVKRKAGESCKSYLLRLDEQCERIRHYMRRWREDHRNQEKARKRQYQIDHPDKCRAYCKRYWAKNCERINRQRRAWYAEHKAEVRASMTEYLRKWRFRNAVRLYMRDSERRDKLKSLTKFKFVEYVQWFIDGGEDAFFDDLDARLGLHE